MPSALLHHSARLTESFLRRALADQPDIPPRLRQAIEYSVFAGGKRIRPTLVIECAAAIAGSRAPESSDTTLAAAAAIELIHTFSLVHDDLPAMDDDDLRRGRPTNHKVFGEALAILAADAMSTLGFEILARYADPTLVPRLALELAHATGPVGMIAGQVLDIDNENRALSLPELQDLHRRKTGALLTCACRMGAIAAGATQEQLAAITTFGQQLGLAFQIVDDLLDVTSTPEQMGKATGKDAAAGKNTYPRLLGLDKTRAAADAALQAALAAIAPMNKAAEPLATLANFVVQRQA